MLFHSPQSAHWPDHLGALAPQFWQTICKALETM